MKKSVTVVTKKLYLDRKPHSNKELYDAIDKKFIDETSYNAKSLYHQARAVQQHLKRTGSLINVSYGVWQKAI